MINQMPVVLLVNEDPTYAGTKLGAQDSANL